MSTRQMAIMFDESIQMVDLHTQYRRLKSEIDAAIQSVLNQSTFINGPQVQAFADHLAAYIGVPYVVPCANGTDAIQIALMALGLQAGDEVIVPAFTYIAAAEAVALLGMTPVLVDVDPYTFTINPDKIEHAISRQTKAIIAVHLFGQCADMEPILRIGKKYNLAVIEDNAQSIGATYTFRNGVAKQSGTIGDVGTTSFFPSKPLACYGDGGAMMTSDEQIARQLKMVASHGQSSKYQHQVVGCNSRLDTIQAAILDVKLKYISSFTRKRISIAAEYDRAFADIEELVTPQVASFSTHVYHQYTLQVKNGKRDALKEYLKQKGIPSMVYYPASLERQPALRGLARKVDHMPVALQLPDKVLSLPIHTELKEEMVEYMIEHVRNFFS